MSPPQRNRRVKELDLRRLQGISAYIDDTEVLAHIKYLNQYQSYRWISMMADVPEGTIVSWVLYSNGRVFRESAERVLAVRMRPEEKLLPAERVLAARRIVQGLHANGFTYGCMTQFLSMSRESIATMMSRATSWDGMHWHRYHQFMDMAVKLDGADPHDYGVPARVVNMAKAKARNRHLPPLAAWDLETIHRAEVTPEWTGACGTHTGYYLHLKYNLAVDTVGKHRTVVCDPCVTAKTEYAKEGKGGRPRTCNYDEIMRLRIEEGMPYHNIADLLGVAKRTIERVILEGSRCNG